MPKHQNEAMLETAGQGDSRVGAPMWEQGSSQAEGSRQLAWAAVAAAGAGGHFKQPL